jgi:exosortase
MTATASVPELSADVAWRAHVAQDCVSPRRWFVACCTAALVAALAGWIVAESLGDQWHLGLTDAESSHVLLVPLMFVWLVWARRRRCGRCDLRGRWPGAAIVAVGFALWAQGYRYQIQSFWHLGAVMLAAGAVLTVLGSDVLWRFLPAWAALLFLVPVPGRVHLYIAVPLERVVAAMTQSLAEVLGINVGRSGNQLSVNGVDVCIAEACNGLRLVFTLFMACYVFAFVKPLRWWVRLLVIAASPVVAIVCNVIRLVPTVWMFGHTTRERAELFHDSAGWLMLVLAFVVLTGIAHVLAWVGIPVYSGRSIIRRTAPASSAHAVAC